MAVFQVWFPSFTLPSGLLPRAGVLQITNLSAKLTLLAMGAMARMNSATNNPEANQLGPAFDEDGLKAAVTESGYPLQTAASSRLHKEFRIWEEWSFLDRDSDKLRALDIRADKELFDLGEGPELRLRPHLTLLVECKSSQSPYVFFLSPTSQPRRGFPRIAGLHSTAISLITDDTPSSFTYSLPSLLRLDKHSFAWPNAYCMTFSQLVNPGNPQLSGSKPYHSLVRPLTKALLHFDDVVEPPETAVYFDVHAVIAVALLGAPMVGAPPGDSGADPYLLPWVRVFRHEFKSGSHWLDRRRFLSLDAVHWAYFDKYLQEHLLPFAREFSRRVKDHPDVIATGKGYAPDLGSRGMFPSPLDELEPRDSRAGVARWKAGIRRLIGFFETRDWFPH